MVFHGIALLRYEPNIRGRNVSKLEKPAQTSLTFY
jgi:hypothetical protein